MKFRSALPFFIVGITSFGFVGCGNSGGVESFVATAAASDFANIRDLVFNFGDQPSAFGLLPGTESSRLCSLTPNLGLFLDYPHSR